MNWLPMFIVVIMYLSPGPGACGANSSTWAAWAGDGVGLSTGTPESGHGSASAESSVEPGAVPAPAELPSEIGTGEQELILLLTGAQRDVRILVERPGMGTIQLRDPGRGYLSGVFRGEPARVAQLTIMEERPDASTVLFDGMVMLPDTRSNHVAFKFLVTDDKRRVRRLPVAPSSAIDLALDQRIPFIVAFGWGALVLLYVLGISWLWIVRAQRRVGEP